MELSFSYRGAADSETTIALPQKTEQEVISFSYWADTVAQRVSGHPRGWSHSLPWSGEGVVW